MVMGGFKSSMVMKRICSWPAIIGIVELSALFYISLFIIINFYRQRSVIDYLISKASGSISLPSVQHWLKIVTSTDNNPLHNYICASSNVYRRKHRIDGLPILTSVVRKLVEIGTLCGDTCGVT